MIEEIYSDVFPFWKKMTNADRSLISSILPKSIMKRNKSAYRQRLLRGVLCLLRQSACVYPIR